MIKLGLSTDESYLLPNVNKSQLAKKLNIETIPRYIIIDKKGRVINQDSPRPSDPKIKNIFNELLNIQ